MEEVNTEEYQKGVLAGLLSCEDPTKFVERVDFVLRQIQVEHFSGLYKPIFQLFTKYYFMTSSRIPSEHFTDLLKSVGIEPDKRASYEVLFFELTGMVTSDSDFKFNTYRLKEQTKADRMIVALSNTMEILVTGKRVKDVTQYGYVDAKAALLSDISDIEKISHDFVPEGNINEETDEVMDEYEKKTKITLKKPVRVGISEIDRLTFGVQPGELWLLAGYAGEGKTTLLCNIAWHACYVLGKNVVFGTAETLRNQVRRRIITRHSRLPKFGLPGGLQYYDIKNSALNTEQKAALGEILKDMGSNKSYGRFELFQIPHKAGLSYLESKLAKYQSQFDIDVFCLDYIGLMSAPRKRQQQREELDELLIGTKQLAVTHNGGAGLAIITPYQVSREAWKEAQKTKSYAKSCLANSAEAERSADLVWSLLRLEDNQNEIRCQVLKYRDGDEIREFYLRLDAPYCYIGSKEETKVDLI